MIDQEIAVEGDLTEESTSAVMERLVDLIGDGPFVICAKGHSPYLTPIWRIASESKLVVDHGNVFYDVGSGTLVRLAKLPARYGFVDDQLEIGDGINSIIIAPLRSADTLGVIGAAPMDEKLVLSEDNLAMIAFELWNYLIARDAMYGSTSPDGVLEDLERQQISGVWVCAGRLFIELANRKYWAHSYEAVPAEGSRSLAAVTFVTFKTNGSIAFAVRRYNGDTLYHVFYPL